MMTKTHFVQIFAFILVALITCSQESSAKDLSKCKVTQPHYSWNLLDGECKNGLAYGKGRAKTTNGDRTYHGEFQNGKFHGYGIIKESGGLDKYAGQWREGERHGHGIRIFFYETYDGEWKDGKKHGQGIATYKKGNEEYIEKWDNGELKSKKPSGCIVRGGGKSVWKLVSGDCKDGFAHGKGKAKAKLINTSSDEFSLEEGTYEGGFQNGGFHGKGGLTLSYPYTLSYNGEWKDGKRHGQGTEMYHDNEYIGQWKDGKRHGKFIYLDSYGIRHTIFYEDGAEKSRKRVGRACKIEDASKPWKFIEGKCKNGLAHGKGKAKARVATTTPTEFTYDEYSYEGGFIRGLFHSQGTMIYPDGSRYNGKWKKGKRRGKGKYIWVNGDVYDGQWKDGEVSGRGIMTYADGRVYTGQWRSGKKHGQGTMTWTSGKWKGVKYIGLFNADNFKEGVMSYPSGSRYDGQWKDGEVSGRGIMTYADGRVYTGQWRSGKKHGQGTMTWTSGDIYVGQWEYDKRHGKGKWVRANGLVSIGIWKNDQEVKITSWSFSHPKHKTPNSMYVYAVKLESEGKVFEAKIILSYICEEFSNSSTAVQSASLLRTIKESEQRDVERKNKIKKEAQEKSEANKRRVKQCLADCNSKWDTCLAQGTLSITCGERLEECGNSCF